MQSHTVHDEKYQADHFEVLAKQPEDVAVIHGDDAARAIEGQDVVGTPQEIRALRRKQDFILVPIMAFGVGLLLVDKTAMGSAATLTLREDLDLKGSEYSWAVSIYFFGLLLGTYPSNLLIQRFHTGRVLACAYFCWGGVMLGTFAVKNFTHLAICRFLLGLFESTNNPAFVSITSRFWTPEEQPVRYSLWAVGNTVLPIPFLVIFFAIGGVPRVPLEPWRWIFILLGLVTITMGAIILVFFPDSPATCWWLTPRERALAVARIARVQTGIKNHTFKKDQFIEAVTDVKVWIIALLLVFQQPAPGISTNFSGIIIKGYGFTGLQSLLLQLPGWVVPCVVTPLVGYLATYVEAFRRRKLLMIAGLSVVALISEVMLYRFPPLPGTKPAIPLAFISLMSIDQSIYPLINTLCGQNFGGSTKRQTTIAIVWTMYCVSNIAVPQSFKASQSPRFQDGIITVMSAQSALTLLALLLFVMYNRENRKRDAAASHLEVGTDQEIMAAGLQDTTDKKNPLFRYYA